MTFYCNKRFNTVYLRLLFTDPKTIRLQPVSVFMQDDGRAKITGNGLAILVSEEEFEKNWTIWETEDDR